MRRCRILIALQSYGRQSVLSLLIWNTRWICYTSQLIKRVCSQRRVIPVNGDLSSPANWRRHSLMHYVTLWLRNLYWAVCARSVLTTRNTHITLTPNISLIRLFESDTSLIANRRSHCHCRRLNSIRVIRALSHSALDYSMLHSCG